ncbi:MAG: hypothetical protein HY454_01000 [Parcubacteria group bacterium]|nr:hypothetical protein [Parcubacteria group bacterium]
MARANPRKMDFKVRMRYLDLLWTSIAGLHSRDEIKSFFKDLLSESEAVMLARRIFIAKELLAGKGYDEIAVEIKTSHATIASVHRWLMSGFGGYENAIARFEAVLKQRFKKSDSAEGDIAYSFGWLRKKYPLHFLLFNLLMKKEK